jgi:hypothetical protein
VGLSAGVFNVNLLFRVVSRSRRRRRRLASNPQEEVSMQSSCFTKGLLIAENAG